MDYLGFGIAIYDSSNQNYDIFCIAHDSNQSGAAPYVFLQAVRNTFMPNLGYWSQANCPLASGSGNAAPIPFSARERIWLRSQEDGQGNRAFSVSSNGRDWILLWTCAVGNCLGNGVGIGVRAGNGTGTALPPWSVRVLNLQESSP